jgi:hypothetical protein
LAREASISGYETMSKSTLFIKLREQYDFDRLQRQENRRLKIEESMKGKKRSYDDLESSSSSSSKDANLVKEKVKYQPLNKIDPIMFTPIKKKKTFKIVRPNGGAVVFNIDTLIDYISKTGDFTDPVTRIPLSDEDLQAIDIKVLYRSQSISDS